MSLTEKFRESAIEQSLGRNTITCYAHWHRQFYAFCKVPARLASMEPLGMIA